MRCNYMIDGECTFPIATSCETACPYMRLLEDYTELKQTYKACVNEHKRVVEQNKQLQAQYNRLLEETRLTS